MKIAFNNLKSKAKQGNLSTNSYKELNLPVDDIETNAYYVRFLPDTEEEQSYLEEIEDSMDIYLYDVPYDYEITQDGDYYHDPSIPLNLPTWQYTAVSTQFDIQNLRNRGIDCQILDGLYLPNGYQLEEVASINDVKTQNKANFSLSFANLLVDEAEKIAGNTETNLNSNQIANNGLVTMGTSFNPQGKIRVFDTRLNKLIPLEGVKVRARRWFTIREVLTDVNGNYFSGTSFSRPVNYAIFYEGNNFDVRSGTYGQAWYDGPKQSGIWNVDIMDGVQRFYAHVFRGAYRYQNKNIGDLRRPGVASRIKYAAYNFNKDNYLGINNGNWGFWGIVPNIEVYIRSKGRDLDSDEIFSTVVHETAHSAHLVTMNAGFIQLSQVTTQIIESWATAVEWYITALEYKDLGLSNYGLPSSGSPYQGQSTVLYARQTWIPGVSLADYTPLFIDLVDDYNQLEKYNIPIDDKVKGYTLGGIEKNVLKHSYGLTSLATNLKNNKPTGVTDSQIDLLLSKF